jgi:hypothetical protein
MSILGEKGEPAVISTEISFKRDGLKNKIYESFEDFIFFEIKQSIEDL